MKGIFITLIRITRISSSPVSIKFLEIVLTGTSTYTNTPTRALPAIGTFQFFTTRITALAEMFQLMAINSELIYKSLGTFVITRRYKHDYSTAYVNLPRCDYHINSRNTRNVESSSSHIHTTYPHILFYLLRSGDQIHYNLWTHTTPHCTLFLPFICSFLRPSRISHSRHIHNSH